MKKYTYNKQDYFSEYALRNAIFNNERKVFGEITTDAEWKKLGVTVSEYIEPAEPEKTLDELKSEKLSELTSITSKFDNQLVNTDMIIKSSLGFSINADLRSQNNLRGLITIGVEPVNFVTADNSVKSLNIEQLNVLLSECAQNGQHLYLLKWQYREQIEQAQTVEELNTIEFNFTMHDFSKEEVVADE